MSDYSDFREDYRKGRLLESEMASNPFNQFEKWFDDAVKLGEKEPNAMTLSTVDSEGWPSARVVLLKKINRDGFVFYTNYTSHKAQEIDFNHKAHLTFLWIDLERQVRVKGEVAKVSREESEQYFHSRPRGSQIGAWVSHQSTVIDSHEELEKKVKEIEERFKDYDEIPLPEFWGGYRLSPISIEFWQGRTNRLHDRILYTKAKNDTWDIVRLSP